MIVTSLLGSWFGTCVHRKAIREFWFIQNSDRRDSVFCSTHERHQTPRYPGFGIRGLLAFLAAFSALPGSSVISGPAYSQTLMSDAAQAGEVSIVQVPAGRPWHSVGPRTVMAPSHPRPEATSALTKMAEQVAVAHTLPIGYFLRLIRQESGFNPNSISPTGAQGIAQFMPATASERGLQDPFDPAQALPKSAELLNELRDKFGNFGLAAAAYNAGTDRVHKWLAGKSPLPQETIDYVRVITGHDAADWAKSNDLVLLQNFDTPASLPRLRVAGTSWETQLLATLQAAPADASSGSSTSITTSLAISTPTKKGKLSSEASLCPHCILQPRY
jgi:Transglycosylase SLT domain